MNNSFLAEMKRRNVFRVGTGYAVVAWLLLQAADILLGNFGAPDWVFKSLTVIILLGFPLSLFLAWAYEMTPEGVVRLGPRGQDAPIPQTGTSDYLLIAVLVVVGTLIVLDVLKPWSAPAVPTEIAQTEGYSELPAQPASVATTLEAQSFPNAPAPPSDASIAVLPFANMSPDPDNAYFADGMSEEVLNVLSRVAGLQVASRTSSFSYRGSDVDFAEMSTRLGVAHILEGSVRKQGQRVRITAQLVDARTDRRLWADSFDRELEDIFLVQEEIAQAIVDALADTLGIRQVTVQPPTRDLDAYELYLRGRELFAQRRELPEARLLVKRALEQDPGFASAWATLASIYVILPGYQPDFSYPEARALALQSAERSLNIDPDNALALSVMAMVERQMGNRLTSGLLSRRAIEADPNNPSAWLWHAMGEGDAGRLRSARTSLDRARAQDPLGGVYNLWLATTLAMLGEYEIAAEPLRRAREAEMFSILHEYDMALDEGRRADAARIIREWSRNPTTWNPELPPDEIRALAEAVARAIESPDELPATKALIQATVAAYPGQNHWAWFKFAEAYEETIREALRPEAALPANFLLLNFWWPRYSRMRSMPEFYEFAAGLGLVDYWEEFGYPDFCVRLDETPVRLDCSL